MGLAGGIYLVCSGDVRPVSEINSNGHGRGGVAGTGDAGHGGGVTKRKGHTGKRKRPRSITERPQHGECRDEVRRYGCGEKPIQNPYGHEKTGHFTALQDTIRNNRKIGVGLAPQGERDNRLHQQTISKNKSFGFGKDEVGGSNPPSSSTQTRCPARDNGFLVILTNCWSRAKTHTETHTDKKNQAEQVNPARLFLLRPGRFDRPGVCSPGLRGRRCVRW